MVTRCHSLQVPNKRLINIQTLVRNYKPLNFFFSLVLTSNNPPLKIHCENIIVAFLNFNFLFFIILFFFTKTHQKIKLLEFIHSHSRTYHFFFFSFFFLFLYFPPHIQPLSPHPRTSSSWSSQVIFLNFTKNLQYLSQPTPTQSDFLWVTVSFSQWGFTSWFIKNQDPLWHHHLRQLFHRCVDQWLHDSHQESRRNSFWQYPL